jgi:hypothetical protein
VVIDLNPTKIKRSVFSQGLADVLDAQMKRKNSRQPARHYVGASSVGGECERAIQFEYAKAPRERAHSANTLRKFDLGHLTEEWARFEFKDAGFELVQRDPRTLKDYRFVQLDGRFSGEGDGVFLGGPTVPGLKYPATWEHKGVGAKSYRAIERDGLKKAKPVYYAQVATCQAYTDLTNDAVFTVSNLDSGEQMHLAIPFDGEEAQRMTDRAVRIVKATEAGELLPRPFAAADHFVCRSMCDFPARCWSLPK